MIEKNFICFVLFTLTLFISDISKLYGQENLPSQKKLLIQEKQSEQKKRLPKWTMDELKKKLPRLKDMPVGTYVGKAEDLTIEELLIARFNLLSTLYDSHHEAPMLVETINYIEIPSFEPKEKFEALSTKEINLFLKNKKIISNLIDIITPYHNRVIFDNEAKEKWFGYVRQIFTINRYDGELNTCTGTFVSSQIMITTAHCLEKADIRYGILLKRVITDDNRDKPGDRIEVQSGSYLIHPEYTGLKGVESIPFNIAVIQWPTVLDSVSTSVKLIPYTHLPEQNQDVDAMGFNRIIWSNGYIGNTIDGQLRSTNNRIYTLTNNHISISGSKCSSLSNFGYCQFNGDLSLASLGDGGGPLFPITTPFYLIGALCCGEALSMQNESQASSIAHYTSVWAPETRAFLKPALIKAGYDAELFPPGY